VIGGGAGVAPSVGSVSGNTTKFATVNTTTFVSGNCVQVDASSNLTTASGACGTGGGGLPLIGTGATVTTSQPLLDLSQTWNASAVAFEGVRLNITGSVPATAAAGSKLFDVQVGGTSALYVGPDGNTVINQVNGNYTGIFLTVQFQGLNYFTVSNAGFIVSSPGGTAVAQIGSGGNNAYITFAGYGHIANDTDNTNNIALHNGAAGQTFRVYNTRDGIATGNPANYERGVMDWTTTANTLTIGSQSAGTGINRSVILIASGPNLTLKASNGTQQIDLSPNGFYPTGGTVDLGYAGGGFAWRGVYAAGPYAFDAGGTINTGISRIAAGVIAVGNGTAGNASGTLQSAALQATGTVPTGNTGSCTTGVTVAGGATAGTWTSTAICAVAGTIILSAMPTMTTGYACFANDRTTAAVVFQQTASTTTSATLTVRSTATAANDVISYHCTGY
jgi:hypothetical protein